jgi:hypothetical protein
MPLPTWFTPWNPLVGCHVARRRQHGILRWLTPWWAKRSALSNADRAPWHAQAPITPVEPNKQASNGCAFANLIMLEVAYPPRALQGRGQIP